MLKVTNTQPGPRGFNAVGGPVLLEPGESVEARVYARESEHMKASGWFKIAGEFERDPGSQAPADPPRDDAAIKKAAGDLLAQAETLHFKTFEADAKKILGDATPSTKDEIVAELQKLAA